MDVGADAVTKHLEAAYWLLLDAHPVPTGRVIQLPQPSYLFLLGLMFIGILPILAVVQGCKRAGTLP